MCCYCCRLLQMSIRSIWHVMFFNSHAFSFCADDLSIGDSRVLNLLKITMLCIIWGSRPNSTHLMECGVPVFAVYMLDSYFNIYKIIFFISSVQFQFESIFKVTLHFCFLSWLLVIHFYIITSRLYLLILRYISWRQ